MDSHRSRLPLAFSFLLIVCATCSFPSSSISASPAITPTIEVFSSTIGGATEAVVRELSNAKQEFAQAYSFTSVPIPKALVDAHKRGVKVTVVLDKNQRSEKYSSADFVNNAWITTGIDAKHAIAHNKIMIIDGAALIRGGVHFRDGSGGEERGEPTGDPGGRLVK